MDKLAICCISPQILANNEQKHYQHRRLKHSSFFQVIIIRTDNFKCMRVMEINTVGLFGYVTTVFESTFLLISSRLFISPF